MRTICKTDLKKNTLSHNVEKLIITKNKDKNIKKIEINIMVYK